MNGNETRTYEFPSQSLPTLEIAVHLRDMQEIIDFIASRGISTKNKTIQIFRILNKYIEFKVNK